MSDTLDLLLSRNSAPRITGPAPAADEFDTILRAGLRAPDHAWLTPWRFVIIREDRREAFGEVLADALRQRDPDADEAALDKARAAPLRAPVLVVVIAHIKPHPKVPPVEQRLSAGCAAHAMLLACEALGYAGIWRTGGAAFDQNVHRDLGAKDNEEIIGFLYIGTRDGDPKPLPQREPRHFASDW